MPKAQLPNDHRQMVTTEWSEEENRARVVVAPNQSLTWHESLIFFAAAAAVSLAVAIAFSVMGYWPVLPFAGLELLALGGAVYVVAQRARRCQVITVTADRVRVEKGRLHGRSNTGGGPHTSREFPRSWTRVDLIRPRRGWYPTRLLIGASGERVAIGEFLTDEERVALKADLEAVLNGRGAAGGTAPE